MPRPGGAFVFDVGTPARERPADGVRSWEASVGGFWRAGPYLALNEHFEYPEASIVLDLVIIVEPAGETTVYRIWERLYTPEAISAELLATGFLVEEISGDLAGAPPSAASPSLGVIARKP